MGRIARRGPKAIALVDKERNEKFQHLTEGSTVEVSSDEPGFEGAWFRAKILRSNSGFSSNRNRKFSVQYQNLVSDDDPSELLTENVDASFIRPVPPPPATAQTYEKDDVVDAFHRDGWWKGVVTEIDGLKGTSKSRRKYTVTFENPHEQFKFSSGDMRFHWVWIHGKWVRHPKHKEVQYYRKVLSSANKSRKNPFEQSTPLSSTSTGKKQKVSAPQTKELTPSCSDGFRMETSTNFGSPIETRTTSLLGNSVEHIKHSTLSKCSSSFDTRENLQLDTSNSPNKGKISVSPSRTQCEDQSVHVPNTVSSTIDNSGEEQLLVKKMRMNPLEKPTSFSSASTSKKQKMPTPETIVVEGTRGTKAQGRLAGPVVRRKWRKRPKALPYNLQREEQSAQIPNEGSITADNPGEDSPLQHASSKLKSPAPEIEKTCPNCSIKDHSVPLSPNINPQSGGPISLIKGQNSFPNQPDAGVENEMIESSEKRETELSAQLTDEHPADIINEECVENGFESSAANAQSESELLRNEDLSFRKSSYLWEHFDSLEVFKVLPQRPHFSPLLDCNDVTREGTAIGHMWTFISMVEKVSKLKIDDPRSLFDSYLEALDILELLGFDVKTVADRAKESLSLKTNHERVDDQSKKLLCEIAQSDNRKVKLEQEISEIDQKMRELEEQRAIKESLKVKEYSASESLQRNVSNLKDNMLALEHKFKVKAGAPW